MVDNATFWTVSLGIGLGTFALRACFVYALERIKLTENAKLLLSFIPPAVLAALIGPAFILHNGAIEAVMGKERLIAGVVAAATAWKTRNMLLTILSGMACLYVQQYFLG